MLDWNNSSNNGVDFHLQNDNWENVHIDVSTLKNWTLRKVLHILENEDMYFLEDTENRSDNDEKIVKNNINDLTRRFKKITTSCLKKNDKDPTNENLTFFPWIYDNEWNLNDKFDRKFKRYFPMYLEAFIKNVKENILKVENNNITSVRPLEDKLEVSIEKFNNIIFIFGDKLTPVQFEKVMKIDDINLDEIKNDIEAKYIELKPYPELLKMYRASLVFWITDDKWIDQESVKNKIDEHLAERFQALFREFENWYTFGTDISSLSKIQHHAMNFSVYINKLWELGLSSKYSGLGLHEKMVSFLQLEEEKKWKTCIMERKNFESKFQIFDQLVMQWKWEYREKYQEPQGSEITFLEWLISEVHTNKEWLYDDIVNKKLEDLSSINSAWEISPEFRNLLSYTDKKLAFFTYIFHENDLGEIVLSDTVPQKDLYNNNKFKIFASDRYKCKSDNEIELLASRFEKIVKSFPLYDSMYDFLQKTWDDLELLTDWYVFNLYEDSGIEEKTESVTNTILRSISKSGSLKWVNIHIEKDEGLQNDSSLDIDSTLDLWNKGFTHFPISIDDEKFSYENKEKKNILFSSEQKLFLPSKDKWENMQWKAIEAWISKGIEVTNLILQNRKIPEYEMEYFRLIKKIWIDIHDKNVISQLRVFLKYCLNRNEKLSIMYDNANVSTQLLENYASWKAEREYINAMKIKNSDSKIWKNKAYFWAFKKLIKAKKGNLRKITDLSRMMNTYDNFTDAEEWIHKFLNYIHSTHNAPHWWIEAVSIDEYTWNYMRKWEKKTGYRDLNLLVKLKWEKNPIEVQFHYRETAKWKQKGINFKDLVQLYKNDWITFTKADIKEIEWSSFLDDQKLPKWFNELCDEWVSFTRWEKSSDSKSKISSQNKVVNADYFYNFTWKGKANMSKELKEKLERMEYLPNAEAIAYTRAEEYKKHMLPKLEFKKAA